MNGDLSATLLLSVSQSCCKPRFSPSSSASLYCCSIMGYDVSVIFHLSQECRRHSESEACGFNPPMFGGPGDWRAAEAALLSTSTKVSAVISNGDGQSLKYFRIRPPGSWTCRAKSDCELPELNAGPWLRNLHIRDTLYLDLCSHLPMLRHTDHSEIVIRSGGGGQLALN